MSLVFVLFVCVSFVFVFVFRFLVYDARRRALIFCTCILRFVLSVCFVALIWRRHFFFSDGRLRVAMYCTNGCINPRPQEPTTFFALLHSTAFCLCFLFFIFHFRILFHFLFHFLFRFLFCILLVFCRLSVSCFLPPRVVRVTTTTRKPSCMQHVALFWLLLYLRWGFFRGLFCFCFCIYVFSLTGGAIGV